MPRLRLKLIVAVMSWLLCAPEGWGQGAPDELHINRAAAIRMAIERNIDVQSESLGALTAELDVERSRSIYNPVLSLSANSGITASPGELFRTRNTQTNLGLSQYLPTGGNISLNTQTGYTTADADNPAFGSREWQTSLGLNLSQPLLRNAWRETTEFPLLLAQTNLEDAFERYRSVITDTTMTVITSYNRLYTLRQVLETRRNALDSAEKFLEEIRQKATPDKPLSMELADADFAVVQRRKDLVETERIVRDQEAGFRYLLGLQGRTTIIPTDAPERVEPPETEEQAVAAALADRPDLRQLQAALRIAEVQERIARRQAMPDLTLTASGGLNGTSGTNGTFGRNWEDLASGQRRFWSAGLQFSYPLGNTSAINEYRRSRIRTEQVKNQLRSLRWRISNDVESDMRSLISARLQLRMADRSLKLAEQRVEEYRKNSQAGTVKVQDLINAQNDLTAARNSQGDAVETFANAVSRLWRDMGTLLDHYEIRMDARHPGKVMGYAADNIDKGPPTGISTIP